MSTPVEYERATARIAELEATLAEVRAVALRDAHETDPWGAWKLDIEDLFAVLGLELPYGTPAH